MEKQLKDMFSYPQNQDLAVRYAQLPDVNSEVCMMYLRGMADQAFVDSTLVPLLMEKQGFSARRKLTEQLYHRLESVSGVRRVTALPEMRDEIVRGNTILFVHGERGGIAVDSTGFEHRSVDRAQNENVIKGPSESFIESGAVNISLIRKQLRNEHLVTESISIGQQSLTEVSVMYLNDIADPQLVKEVKRRLANIENDQVMNLATLEQMIEERSYSLVPTCLYTERPDRAAAFLQEGHVVMLMDSSPSALIAPVTFWALFHSAEDMYQRWPLGVFMRLMRLIGIFIATLTPGLYIAITNYHVEMLPTDLLLAIAATRERVPFPAIIEVMIMEVAFELLREAGVRIPSTIGPTIGIVGALILGQAAVDANIVSPILVIVTAITALSSFTVPDQSLNGMVRLSRFIFLFAASLMGFLGMMIALTIIISYMVTLRSFEVPFLGPLAPYTRSSKDTIFRPPVWKQWLRPFMNEPQETERATKPKGGAER
ncbi:spore germination protein [Tumebacillus avium]|uniref:Spore germination protein n=1 Tax=Tumebacillus avium TaxID=1903704 RepID=A0A1Y0IM80_9BACL|nr:spore germination protein [Tumebacillus avium]ARU60454.1 spore germination protein [Tumebacillus avium]